MKTPKHWTINQTTGEVQEVTPFNRGMSSVEVAAHTKSQATQIMLRQYLARCDNEGPRLWVRNGAYALATHNGLNWSVEGGTLHPGRCAPDGRAQPLVTGTADKLSDVLRIASLDYYSSEQFQSQQ